MGIKPPLQPPPAPPKGGEEPHPASPKGEECLCAHEGDKKSWFFLLIISANTCKLVSSPFGEVGWGFSPPFGGVGGGCRSFSIFTYLSVKQVVTKAFAELVTPVPRKTIVFRIKLLTFANRKEKASPTAPPDLSREGRSADRKISPKMFRS